MFWLLNVFIQSLPDSACTGRCSGTEVVILFHILYTLAVWAAPTTALSGMQTFGSIRYKTYNARSSLAKCLRLVDTNKVASYQSE